jgi:hypothetical protein
MCRLLLIAGKHSAGSVLQKSENLFMPRPKASNANRQKLSQKRPATAAVEAAQLTSRKALFLEQYKAAATVTAAARAGQVDRSTHYEWLKHDPNYVERFRAGGG